MIEVQHTVHRHAIAGSQRNLRTQSSNGPGRGYSNKFIEFVSDGITGQQHDWPALVWRFESVPTEVAFYRVLIMCSVFLFEREGRRLRVGKVGLLRGCAALRS